MKLLLEIKLGNKTLCWGFPGGSVVKNLPAVQESQETWVQSPGREDPLEEGMQPTSAFLPGESPWTEAATEV